MQLASEPAGRNPVSKERMTAWREAGTVRDSLHRSSRRTGARVATRELGADSLADCPPVPYMPASVTPCRSPVSGYFSVQSSPPCGSNVRYVPVRPEKRHSNLFRSEGGRSEHPSLEENSESNWQQYDLVASIRPPVEWNMGGETAHVSRCAGGKGQPTPSPRSSRRISVGRRDGRLSLDAGGGAALLSEHKFGSQCFVGPV